MDCTAVHRQFCLLTWVAYADAEGAPAAAPKRVKPSMRLPMAVVKPKRKAEPPEANGHAASQPAKKQETEDGNGIAVGSGTAQADAPAATANSGEDAAKLGLGDYSDSD